MSQRLGRATDNRVLTGSNPAEAVRKLLQCLLLHFASVFRKRHYKFQTKVWARQGNKVVICYSKTFLEITCCSTHCENCFPIDSKISKKTETTSIYRRKNIITFQRHWKYTCPPKITLLNATVADLIFIADFKLPA